MKGTKFVEIGLRIIEFLLKVYVIPSVEASIFILAKIIRNLQNQNCSCKKRLFFGKFSVFLRYLETSYVEIFADFWWIIG